MTVVRIVIFALSSISLIGFTKDLFLLYTLLDNVFVMMVASVVTYIFLNYQKQVDYLIPAIVSYPFLLFFLCGNQRVMLVFCDWEKWQIIIYKIIKVIGATYFLVYGSCLIVLELVKD
jgi:hypothetical protein